jgi:hypothetical protein
VIARGGPQRLRISISILPAVSLTFYYWIDEGVRTSAEAALGDPPGEILRTKLSGAHRLGRRCSGARNTARNFRNRVVRVPFRPASGDRRLRSGTRDRDAWLSDEACCRLASAMVCAR